LLGQPHPKKPELTRAEVIALRWVRAAERKSQDRDSLLDRTEGKVVAVEPEPEIDLKQVARRMAERRKQRDAERDKPT
jgi:hypothetical protein